MDHYLLVSAVRLKFKQKKVEKTVRPLAVENLEDACFAGKFHLELTNHFEVLQHSDDIEQEWDQLKKCVSETAEEVVGRGRGLRREQWIGKETWQLIDE